jgi:hypothetical protein
MATKPPVRDVRTEFEPTRRTPAETAAEIKRRTARAKRIKEQNATRGTL